jgi:hypothetical protein
MKPFSQELAAHHVQVKFNVVTCYVSALRYIRKKTLNDLCKRQSFTLRAFCRDAVYFFSVEGNSEAFGLNDEALRRQEFTVRVVKLPSYLNDAWPIGKIGEGGVPAAGKAGGFSIEYDEHGEG